MIDRFTLVGTLRATPDLVTTVDGVPCCRLQLVVRNHCKDRDSGLWGEHSRCFAIEVVGSAARRCLAEITVSGRLFWRQRLRNDNVQRNVSVLVADHLQFSRAGAGKSLARAVPPISDASAAAGVLDDAG